MSLVGPHPERPEFVHVLAGAIPDYPSRLLVPPGITGLAQVNLPPDTDLMSVRRRLVLDQEYIEQAGLWMDLRLLMCTFLRMLKLPTRWILLSFGLQREVTIGAVAEGTSAARIGHAIITPTSIMCAVENGVSETSVAPAGLPTQPDLSPTNVSVQTTSTSVSIKSGPQLYRYHSLIPSGLATGMAASSASFLLSVGVPWLAFIGGFSIYSMISAFALAIQDLEDRRTGRE
jgi:hypothetical protein